MVKTTVFLADIDDWPAMNEPYVAAFGDHRPARSAFAVAALPLGALVEIEAWAYVRRTRDRMVGAVLIVALLMRDRACPSAS